MCVVYVVGYIKVPYQSLYETGYKTNVQLVSDIPGLLYTIFPFIK